MAEPNDLICEIRLLESGRARLELDGLIIEGECAVDAALADEIQHARDPVRAGSLLFDALLPEGQATLEAYRKISTEFRQTGARQSVRLVLDTSTPQWVHELPWELLFDPRRRVGLGNSQEVSFLRSLETDRPFPPPIEGRMRLLLAVAAPNDVLHHNLPALDRRFEERTLVGALRRLQDLVHCEVVEAPITAERLKKHLTNGSFHTLHLVAHGRKLAHEDTARILLEDDAGRGVWTDRQALEELLGANPDLHLMTLMACHDGIETRADPFHGLGAALVAGGLPAVVVTRRALTVSQATKVTTHLYRGLALTGRIDEAINEARERLFHSRPERFTWSSPTAYLGGRDSYLWHSEEARRQQVEEDTQSLEMAQFRLEQQRRDQLAAWVEPPPPPKSDFRWRQIAAALAVVVLGLSLGLAGALGRGPLAPWLSPSEETPEIASPTDSRPSRSIDPEATRRAIPRYASACDAGHNLACVRLATIYELGRGVQKDTVKAETYYRQACTGGDWSSCYHLGHLLESPSHGSKVDRSEARLAYERACSGNELRACRRLTVLLAQEQAPAVSKTGEPADDAIATAAMAAGSLPAGDLAQAPDGRPPGTSDPELASGSPASGSDPAVGSPDETASPSFGTEIAGREASRLKVFVDGRFVDRPDSDLQTLADRTGNGDTWIYEVGGISGRRALAGQARGNVYRIFEPAELLEWDVWLDFVDQQDLTFSVHVADADLGSYSSIFSRSTTVQGRGADWYSSGELALSLESGRHYLVAVSWNGELTYGYGLGRQETLFAELTHGHVDFDPILPDVESEVSDLAIYRQRLITSHDIMIDGSPLPSSEPSWIEAVSADLDARWSENRGNGDQVSLLELGGNDLRGGGLQTDTSSFQGSSRGNVVYLDRDLHLNKLSLWLDLPAPTQLEIGIYRSENRAGPFEQLYEKSWSPPGIGFDWYASPDLDVELRAGAYYAILASWDTEVGYQFGIAGSQKTPFGSVAQGIALSTSGLPPSLQEPAANRALYQQRWYVTLADRDPAEKTEPAPTTQDSP